MKIIIRNNSFLVLLLLGFVLMTACQKETEVADTIIKNATIWTGNTEQPTAEAMAIANGKIIAIGTEETVLAFKNETTEILDMEGRFISPGFIDSHVHLMTGGRSLLSVDLRDAKSPEEFGQRVANFVKTIEKEEWVLEGNWDHTLWGGELPNKTWVDEGTPNNPVLLFRLDWHMALANTAALEFAGIDKNTPDVEGGTIERDADGNPTGILKDNAMNLVLDKIPPMSEKQKTASFQAAMDYFLSNGVTTVHDVDGMNKDFESWTTATEFRKNDNLKVRIYAATPLNEWQTLAKANYQNDDWLKAGGLKGFVDGSLGSHTATFKEDYTDKANDKGFFINTHDELYDWISEADKADLHVMVHAIGDSAISTLLDIYEKVGEENGKKDRRFRVEHAQHLDPNDIKRFAELGVIASMQPYHAIDDGRWAEDYIGAERIKTTYAFKSLLEANTTLAFGSDWAVAPASPLQGIYAAVTRRTLDDKNPNGWVAKQKITVEQALSAYTKNAAFASFDEKIKGTLEVGKLADFIVLGKDLRKIEPTEIRNVKVLETYVGGEKMYDRKISMTPNQVLIGLLEKRMGHKNHQLLRHQFCCAKLEGYN